MKDAFTRHLLLYLCCFLLPTAATAVQQAQSYHDPKTGIHVVGGQINLPSQGIW